MRQEIQIVLHPSSTRSMRISTGINSLATTPPNAFFKTYLMRKSAQPPPQHLRKLTLYCKLPTIEPRHGLYIPKDDLKDGRNYFSFAFNCISYR